jgi:hypothetical protein
MVDLLIPVLCGEIVTHAAVDRTSRGLEPELFAPAGT